MSSTIPTTNISFSDIYNVYNDASATGGTKHEDLAVRVPISMGDLISATRPSTDTMASLTPDIDSKFNAITTIYNSTTDAVPVPLVSNFDVANNVSPIVLGNGAKLFTDDGGLNANYSTSHSRHATFDAGAGNCIYINPRDFDFEHTRYSMYDRLGITCSNTIGGLSLSSGNLSSVDSALSQYLYQSSNASPSSFWGTSWVSSNGGYGSGGGYIFPNTAGTDVKGNNNSSWINTWYKIDARYVRFWFKSDGSATEPGWDILVARAATESGLVPIDWTAPSSGSGENIIQNNGSINLNQTTKDKIYTPISGFTFYDNGGANGNVGPSSVSDGTITFDAGENNTFFVTFVRFRFPHGTYGSVVQMGQLFVKSSDSFSTISNYSSKLTETWMIDPTGLQQSPTGTSWNQPGNVLPYSTYGGQSYIGSTYTSSRYIQFTYLNNVENGTGTDYTNREGWEITLQVKDSTGNTDVTNDYSSGDAITTQEVNIKDDFMGRTKNYDPSMQIVEYVGGNYTTNILKNSLFGSGNLGIGLKMPMGAYDLTSSDITIFDGNGETITGFSVADGATETNFSITPPTGSNAYKLRIRVKGNTFYDSAKIWNKPADNDFCWYWNMPLITITSTSVELSGTTGSQKIPITVSCQHRFDISKVLVQSGLKNATIDGNITILDGSKNAIFDIKADVPTPPEVITQVILDIPKADIYELDSGYRYTSYADITPFTFGYEPDVTGPTVVISYDGTNNLGNKTITFTFTELPIGFFVGDITISTEPRGLVANITDLTTSGLVRTGLFSPLALGIYTLSIAANKLTDAAGNDNVASNNLEINLDTLLPIIIGKETREEITLPIYEYYRYSLSASLYTWNELEEAEFPAGSIIKSIAFKMTSIYDIGVVGESTRKQPIRIYIKNAEELPSNSNYDKGTLIFDGDWVLRAGMNNEWKEIPCKFTTQSEQGILITCYDPGRTYTSRDVGQGSSAECSSSKNARNYYSDSYDPGSTKVELNRGGYERMNLKIVI
jgi:hypothetical protein